MCRVLVWRCSPRSEAVQAFLGTDVTRLPLVTEDLPQHRLVDADIALAEVAAASESQLLGVTGGQQRDNASFQELLSHPFLRIAPGPVDFVSSATGPDTERQVVSLGVRLLQLAGHPVAVLQRGARPEFGRQSARLEILATNAESSALLLKEVRRLMLERSVLRGQVLSFSGSEYGQGAAGANFLRRPDVRSRRRDPATRRAR